MKNKKINIFILSLVLILSFAIIYIASTTYSAQQIDLIEETEINVLMGKRKTINIITTNIEKPEDNNFGIELETSNNCVLAYSNDVDFNNITVIITGQNVGTCSVSVTLNDNTNDRQYYDSITVNVIDFIINESINANVSTQFTLPKGELENETLQWESSDTSIATVTSDGVVNPISIGIVKITAYSQQSNRAIQYIVNVSYEQENEYEEPIGEEECVLESLKINNNEIAEIANEMTYTIPEEDDSFKIEVTASASTNVITIKDDAGREYPNGSNITWSSEQNTMLIYIDLCKSSVETSKCKSYILMVIKNVQNLQNDFFETFKINNEEIDQDSFFQCNTEGTQITCEGDYTLEANENKIIVYAPLKSQYSYNTDTTVPHTPGEFDASNNMVIQLDIYKNNISVAIYRINVKVTAPKPTSSSPNLSSNIDSGVKPSQTGDLSTFLIFIIMIISLLSSMIIYKKNIKD